MNYREQHLYERALRELGAKSPNPGLLAMAFVEAEGDEAKAKAIYIKLRVKELRAEEEREQADRRALESELQKKSKIERRELERREKAESAVRQQQEAEVRLGLERACPYCVTTYCPADYRPEVSEWRCRFCDGLLPRT